MTSPGQCEPASSSATPRRWKLLLVSLFVVASGVLVYRFWLGPQWDREEALALAQAGNFDQAEAGLRKARTRDPGDADVLQALARGYINASREAEAIAALDQWVAARPTEIEPLRQRMELHTKRREYDAALADGQLLLERQPEDRKLRRQVLGLAVAAANFTIAAKLCDECLQAEPDDVGLKIRRASIRASLGDRPAAIAQLEAIIQSDPGQMGAKQVLAMLFNENGQPEKAIPLLEEIVARDPSRQRTAGYQLSMALERVGRTEDAKKALLEVRRRQDVEVFRDALQSQPDNLELRVRFAGSLLQDGHVSDALAMLGEVLRRDPRYAPAHRMLAEHYEHSGEKDRAARHRELAGAP